MSAVGRIFCEQYKVFGAHSVALFGGGGYITVPQISRAQGQFVKSDKIAKKLSKMLIWASKIKFRKISMKILRMTVNFKY